MKTKMEKVLAFLMAIFMVFQSMPLTAFADENGTQPFKGATEADIKYSIKVFENKNLDGNNYLLLKTVQNGKEYFSLSPMFKTTGNVNVSNRLTAADGSFVLVDASKVETILINSNNELTLDQAKSGTNCNRFTSGYITKDSYQISVDGTNVVYNKVNFNNNGKEYRMNLNFYGYDGEALEAIDSDTKAYTYFVLAKLKTKGTDKVVAYATQQFGLYEDINNNPGKLQNDIVFQGSQTYSLIDIDGKKLESGGVAFSSENFDIEARIYSVKNKGTTIPSTYSEIINAETVMESVPNYIFFGTNPVVADGKNYYNLKKSRGVNYEIAFAGDSLPTFTDDDNVYVKVEINHQSGNKSYFVKKITSTEAITASNNEWKDNNGNPVKGFAFTGQEQSRSISLIKAEPGTSEQNVIKNEKCSVVEGGSALKANTVAYVLDSAGTHSSDGTLTTYTDEIQFTKINVSSDYNFLSILGNGVYYAITAQTFDQKMHIQANFATNDYRGSGTVIEADLASAAGVFVIAQKDDKPVFFGASHSGDVLLYLGNGKESDIQDFESRDFVYLISDTPENLTNNFVEPIITHGDSISAALADTGKHPETPITKIVKNGGKLEIDTLDYPENATIYIDADAIKDYIGGTCNLHLTKREGQVLVFNFDSSSDVTIGKVAVRYNRTDAWNENDDNSIGNTATPTSKGSKNDWLSELSKHLVWNLASATNVKINIGAGIFLIPREDSKTDITGTSSGWIISDGYVKNSGGEWHGVYSGMPSVDSVNLSAKKMIASRTPTGNEKFNFTLSRLSTINGRDFTDIETVNNENEAIVFDDIHGLETGWNAFRIKETGKASTTTGNYTYDRNEIYAFVQYTAVTNAANSTISTVGIPKYYRKALEGEEATVWFSPAKFNREGDSLSDALNGATSGDVDGIGLIPIGSDQSATFVNEENNEEGIDVEIKAQKTFNNWAKATDGFTFKLTAEGNAPMPEGVDGNETTVDALNATAVGFGTIHYDVDEVTTYSYTVQEVIPAEEDRIAGIEYDDTVYTIQVVVTPEEDGTKSVAISKKAGEGEFEAVSGTSVELGFENYYAEGTAKIEATKAINYWGKTDKFTFVLSADAGVPMVADAVVDPATNAKTKTVEITKDPLNLKAAFGEIKYTLTDLGGATEKTFRYTIQEVEDGLDENHQKNGITYDVNKHTVTVKVTDNHKGELNTEVKYDGANNLEIPNTYATKGEITLKGTKTLKNRDLVDDEFSFELYEVTIGTDDNGSETRTEELKDTVTNKNGTFSFKIEYSGADLVTDDDGNYVQTTKLYKLVEKLGTEKSVFYSTKVYDDIKVTLEDNGEGRILTTYPADANYSFTNTVVKVSKVDLGNGEELEGATIQVLKKDMNGEYTIVVDEWTSTTEAHVVTSDVGLEIGEDYILRETVAPDGYKITADTTFSVDNDGKISYNGTTAVNEETGEEVLLVEDEMTRVRISKVDLDTGDELAGATMQILKAVAADEAEVQGKTYVEIDGTKYELIEQWVSQKGEVHVVDGLLTGVEYILHEQAAPKDYNFAADIAFTIATDGQITSSAKATDKNGNPVLLVKDKLTTKPTFEKEIQDTNDSTGETSKWQDSADYDIGDAVPYRLTATLADNVTDYRNYHITFTDEMEPSLTFNEITSVTVNGEAIDDYELTVGEDKHSFALTLNWAGTDGAKIADEQLNGAKVEVFFTATLNEKAVLGNQGNVNKAMLTYSSNPNVDQSGKQSEETEDTAWDSVIAFTYIVEINKVDEKGNALEGAEFTLKKLIKGSSDPKLIDRVTVTNGTTFTFKGLDDGNYVLTETKTPAGRVTVDPINFTVTAGHTEIWDGTDETRTTILTSLTGNVTTGVLSFAKPASETGDEGEDGTANGTETGDGTGTENGTGAENGTGTENETGTEPQNVTEDLSKLIGTIENEWTHIKVSKVDIADGKELSGATIQILRELQDGEVKDEATKTYVELEKEVGEEKVKKTYEVVDQWVSEKGNPHMVEGLLTETDYILHETVAPDGYTITEDTTFHIEKNGVVNSTGTINSDGVMLVQDAKTRVKVSKVDIDDTTRKELPGATIQILKEVTQAQPQDGNETDGQTQDGTGTQSQTQNPTIVQIGNKNYEVVEEWVSTNEIHVVEGLLTNTTYVLHETVAPDGYTLASDTTFSINEKGTVTNSGRINPENGAMLVEDRMTSVKISKVDVTNGQEVAGAVIQILDMDGNVVKDLAGNDIQWTSTTETATKAHEVKGLTTGVTYILHEVTAPFGFEITADTCFTIDERGNVHAVNTTVNGKELQGTTIRVNDGVLLVEDSPTKTTATILKVWNDDDNREAARPQSLTVKLLANGSDTVTLANGEIANNIVTLRADQGWTYTFQNLRECALKDGAYTPIVYTWTEVNVPAGYTLTGNTTNGKVTVLTNAHVPDETKVTVKKVWVTPEDKLEKQPESIKVQLLADGVPYGASVTLNSGNEWKAEWSELKKYRNVGDTKVLISYTVYETEVPEGYAMMDPVGTTNQTEDGMTVTSYTITNVYQEGNILIRKEFDFDDVQPTPVDHGDTVDIPVAKTWVDNYDQDGNRPGSIMVRLLANGTEVRNAQVTAADGWTAMFYELPRYDNDGNEITYTVTEDPVPGYRREINGLSIRNIYEPETTEATIRKVWHDDENTAGTRPESIYMTLNNGTRDVTTVVLTAMNGWEATVTGLPVQVNGANATYTWREQAVIGYDQTGVEQNGTVTTIHNTAWAREEAPVATALRRPGNQFYVFEDYETPLGVEIMINHVGDCFD